MRLLACPISSPSKHRLYVGLEVHLKILSVPCIALLLPSVQGNLFFQLAFMPKNSNLASSHCNQHVLYNCVHIPSYNHIPYLPPLSLSSSVSQPIVYLDIIIVVLLKQNWYKKKRLHDYAAFCNSLCLL